MVDAETGIVISIPESQQSFLLEKHTDFFGRVNYSFTPTSYSSLAAPVAAAPTEVAGPVPEPIITPEMRAKIKQEAEELLEKTGEEARKGAVALRNRISSYLEARRQKSQEKLEEGVS
jgi:hypothetical protein